MQLLKNLLNKTDELIFESYHIKTSYLGLYRILFCVLTFVFYGIPSYSWIGNSPDYLFSPPAISLGSLFNGFPDVLFLSVLDVVIVILYLALFFGWKTKYTSLLLFLSIFIGQSFAFSFGKIDHNIIWLIVPLIMAFSGWGNAYSIDAMMGKESKQNAWPISLMALLLGFAMFTASVPKILAGWLSPDSQATLAHIVYNYIYWGRQPLLLNEALQIKSAVFWEISDYLTVIFELGFLLAFIKPQVFRFFVIAAVLFHISVFLTLDITFTTNLLPYMLFINWAIFNPLLSSNLYQKIADRVIRPQYLAICASLVFLYAIAAFTLQLEFVFPSIFDMAFRALDMEESVRYWKALILFSAAILIAFASAVTFMLNKANERRQKQYSTTVIEKPAI